MKKSSLTLISLLALSGPVFGQVASNLVASASSGSGTHQFTQSGNLSQLTLCTYELGQVDERGYLHVQKVAAGSASAIVSQASKSDVENYLVFYPAGQEGNADKRRILRKRYLVSLADGANLEAIKKRCGMSSIKLFRPGSNLAICEESSAGRVLSQLTNVLSDPQIIAAEPIFAKKRETRAVPNDPYYRPNTFLATDGNYQWYLNNAGVNGGAPGIDIKFEGALDTRTGAGVTVAVVDDGIATDHEDLVANAIGPHLNFFGDAPANDPATLDTDSNHGTAVAGLIAAAHNNNLGISGVAPGATLSGIRLLPGSDGGDRLIDDAEEAEALLFSNDQIDIYNNSWGPIDSTLDLAAPGPLVQAALKAGIDTGRVIGGEAKGNIYVWAGGNGGGIDDRSDYDGYANSKYTIAVGALDDSGKKSNFSEEGSNLVVVAPSSGGAQDILSTSFGLDFDDDDNLIRTSEYTSTFGGTSASAPIVSGVVALMLQENPNLNWREVQDILMRTAVQVDVADGDWIDNAAGLSFNHKYGAGLVNATAAVALANTRLTEDPIGAVERQTLTRVFTGNSSDLPNDSGIIPNNDGSSLLVSFDMSEDIDENPMTNLRVEHVELRVRVIAERRADLDIVLISPNGTQSVLHAVDADNEEESITNWTFMTVRNWGEGSAGTWVIRISDRVSNGLGSEPAIFQNATLAINGVADPDAPVNEIPILTSSTFIAIDQLAPFSYIIEAAGAAGVAVGDLPEGVSFDAATNTISGAIPEAGLYSVPIVLTDAMGVSGNFSLTIVVRPTSVALGDAVGLAGIPAIFGGNAPWDFELLDVNGAGDGSSARSAVGLEDGQSSIFGFDNLGEGVILFDWKTSSEEGADRLWFNRGGDVPQVWDAFISGQRGWGRTAVLLPETSNNVRWIYSKDVKELNGVSVDGVSVGEDRGLVDNAELLTVAKFTEQLEAAVNLEGFDLEYDSRTLFFPTPFRLGSVDSDGVASLIQSSSIGNGQTVSLAGWVEGPGTLNFSAYNFAEANDLLELLLDGVVVQTIAGQGQAPGGFDQKIVSQAVVEGRHRIQIRFRKDFRGSAAREVQGQPWDWVLLDDLKFVPDGSFAAFAAELGAGFDPDPSADSDGDGFSNHLEYAFGGDPMNYDTPTYLPTLGTSGDVSFIEYGIDTSRTDLNYTAQQSSNLVDWVDAQLATMDRMEGDVEVYRIPVASGPGRSHLFYRVIAEPK